MYNLYYLIERELILILKKPNLFFSSIFSNIINITLFKFIFNDDTYNKYSFFTANIIISLLFTINLSMKDIFEKDIKDGSIEQMLLAEVSYFNIIISKIISFWLIAALPIILALPLVNIFYGLTFDYILINMIILLFASFSLSLITALSVLITVDIDKNSLITNLISFPLSIATLILSVLSIEAQTTINYSFNMEYVWLIIGLNLIILPIIYFTSKFI